MRVQLTRIGVSNNPASMQRNIVSKIRGCTPLKPYTLVILALSTGEHKNLVWYKPGIIGSVGILTQVQIVEREKDKQNKIDASH